MPRNKPLQHTLAMAQTISEQDVLKMTANFAKGPPLERKHRYKNIVHLWEFLLELLADESCRSLITWSREAHGEFKLNNQEEVARRWGELKHRNGMNYEKLSRALSHYYKEGIIKKVAGQRLVYKFHKLPYEYTPGVTRLRDGKEKLSTPANTIKPDQYYSRATSQLSIYHSNLPDKEKIRIKILEGRIGKEEKQINAAAYSQEEENLSSVTVTPEPSPLVLQPQPCYSIYSPSTSRHLPTFYTCSCSGCEFGAVAYSNIHYSKRFLFQVPQIYSQSEAFQPQKVAPVSVIRRR